MLDLEPCLWAAALFGSVVGSFGIVLARGGPLPHHVSWGRRLFLATLFMLVAACFVGAVYRAEGLAPLGLAAGVLVVGMLWEGPLPQVNES